MRDSARSATLLASRRGEFSGVWDICRGLLGRIPPRADVVAVTPPGSWLAYRLRATVEPDHLFAHAPELHAGQPGHPDDGPLPIVPSERERDRLTLPRGPWPFAPPPPAARERALDTLYADSHAIGLLIVDCGCQAPAILRGAGRVLMTQAPLIAIDVSAAAPSDRAGLRNECMDACFGYAWKRGAGKRRGALAVGWPKRCGMEVAAWRDPPLAADAVSRVGLGLTFDDALPALGLYPAEADGGGQCWRWTGPGTRAAFHVPVPAPGAWRVTLRVLNWGVVTAPDELRCYANGRGSRPDRADADSLSFIIRHDTGPLLIELVTPATRRASAEDPRLVGINLAGCTVEPAR